MAEEMTIKTSDADWFLQLARAYKMRIRVLLVDDAGARARQHPTDQLLRGSRGLTASRTRLQDRDVRSTAMMSPPVS
jgi:hypothetical protein